MYKSLLKPILFRFDPENIHNWMTSLGEFLGSTMLTRVAASSIYNYRGPDISRTIDGNTYRTPFILAAGFDYNGRLTQILPAIGLGGVEVGSVTARPCTGNLPPRLRRLPRSRSILVSKGLRNEGVKAIVARLEKRARTKGFVVGISLARTNDTQTADVEAGIEDYCTSLKHCLAHNVGDYYTLNISCPNAFGGETFTTPSLLKKLLEAVKKIPCSSPVYVKMPINLTRSDFNNLLQVIADYNLAGVIIGNLNKDYSALDFRAEAPAQYVGGLSGKPCRDLSTSLIRQTREHYGQKFTIIGCGGVMSPKDAADKFSAGADLVQLITGLIYEGPGLVKKLCYSVTH
ncbi:MAG: quinone-dependent dihydroorotate dehydrogenase [Candidatus Vogelbacteria bacterium]